MSKKTTAALVGWAAVSTAALVVVAAALFFEAFEGLVPQGRESWWIVGLALVPIFLVTTILRYKRRCGDLERESAESARAMGAARSSEARYRAVVAGLPAALFVVDPEGRFVLAEGMLLNALNLEADRIVGCSIFEVYRDAPRVVESVRRALGGVASGATVEVDGLALEMRCSPFRENGEFSGVIGVATDVTERERAEEARRRSENSLAAAQRIASVGNWEYEIRKDEAWWSDEMYRIHGFGPGEFAPTYRTFLRSVHPDDRRRVRQATRAILHHGRQGGLEYRVVRSGSSVRAVHARYEVVRGEDGGKGARLAGTVQDVTERKQAEERSREAEAKYRSLVEQIPAVTYTQGPNSNHRFASIFLSPQVEDLLGYAVEEFASDEKLWTKLLHPDDRERVLTEDARTDRTGEPFEMEYRVIHKNGRVVWVRDEAVLVEDAEGRPRLWQGVMFDITKRREAEEALRKSEASLAETQRLAHLGGWEWDVRGGKTVWSDEVYRIYGLEPGEIVPSLGRLMELVHPDDRGLVEKKIDEALRAGKPYDFEHRIVRPGGEARVVHRRAEVLCDAEGKPVKMVGTVHDVTERDALKQRLEYQALHDPLTLLANRALFMDRLEQARARVGRSKGGIAVLFMDLDDFKVINDSLGHEAGDRLLVEVAERLRTCLRPADTAARLGGDEFVVLLEDVPHLDEASRVAERIAEELGSPFTLDGREVFVTASIGIALSGAARGRTADLMRDADLAMYRAKRGGKSRHEVFEEAMNSHAFERLEMGNDLRRAIARDEFVVHYQPKVSLESGEIVGAEALVRWEHPERGLVAPARFIPFAEEIGLIVPTGSWVLREACREAERWRRLCRPGALPSIAVNLSARQFRDPGLVEEVVGVLEETGLEPSGLVLEITESVLMEDAPSTTATLRELKALGVKLAIDDFGTGYSSLSYLKRFPADFLKIDRSFVGSLGEDRENEGIVSAIIDLAHTLGLKAVAEGVETTGQLERLRKMGCDMAQGYYFARPMPGEEALALLANAKIETYRKNV